MDHKVYPRMKWTSEMVSRFWDWQSQFPGVYFSNQFGEAIARTMRSHLNGRDVILDYGCGVGYLLEHLCKYGNHVCGTDLSPESVDKVNARLKGVDGFSGAYTVETLQNEGRKFDAIVAIEIIEHLYDDQIDGMLTQIGNMLSPDGVVVFTTPNNEDLALNMILCPATGEEFHRWQHVRTWNRETLSAYLEKSGFKVVSIVETNFSNQMPRSPLKLAKWLIKQVIFSYPKTPHLLCAATKF